MKNLVRSLILGAAMVLSLSALPAKVFAASATLYLSPGSSSVAQGATLIVNIRENSGSEPVNSVQANLSYPANLLDFVKINDGSAWGVKAENSGGGGSVRIARGAFSAVSGDQLVASVHFKAKTSSGSATINFASGSQVISANSNSDIMAAANGGTYTFKAPAPAAEAAAAPPADTAPPTIGTVNVTDINYTSAVISWTTSEPATTEVNYGYTNSYGWVEVDKNPITEHKVTLATPLIAPGKSYHFMVKSVDPAGNAATGLDGTFTTKGASLTVTVVNQKDKALNGAKVAFGDINGVTKDGGKVTLEGLPLGKQTGIITYKGKQTPANIQLDTINDGQPHTVKYKIEVKSDFWLKLAVLLLALTVIGLIIYRRRGGPGTPQASGDGGGTSDGESPVGFFGKLKKGLTGLKDRLPKKETMTAGPIIEGPVAVKAPPEKIIQPQSSVPKPEPSVKVAVSTPKAVTSGPVNQSQPPKVVPPLGKS